VVGKWAAVGVIVVAIGVLAAPAPTSAQGPPSVVGPFAGEIPFRCELQNVGTGTAFPDPGADPFCVEFDKTNQNVTDFGLVEFTAQEPARAAAAATKCFYFQRDHWTGSVVQGSEPEVWHWDGDYYFDRARGVGGVSVRNFRLGGEPLSASPYVPAAYAPYFDQAGGGGAEVLLESGPDPSCASKVDTPEERDRVYGGRGIEPDCIEPGGKLRGKRIGRAKLGMRRGRLLSRLGPPADHAHRVDRWCLVGKGELRAAYRDRRAIALLTSGRGQSYRGVARGDRGRRAHRRLVLERAGRVEGAALFEARAGEARRLLLGISRGRVRWLVLARPSARLSPKRLARLVAGVG